MPEARPRVRRILIVFLIIALLAAGWSAWDYYEARRLRQVLAGVQARGEPITLAKLRARPAEYDDPLNAGRYYAAASALLVTPQEAVRAYRTLHQIMETSPQSVPDADVVARVEALLEQNAATFDFLDLAKAPEFKGFTYAARESVGRTAGLERIGTLLSARTLVRALSGQGEAAIATLVDLVRLGPIVDVVRETIPQKLGVLDHVTNDLPLVLERTEPSDVSLASLQQAVGTALPETDLGRYFTAQRASYIEFALPGLLGEGVESGLPLPGARLGRRPLGPTRLFRVGRPWLRRQILANVAHLTSLVSASHPPVREALAAIEATRATEPVWRWPFGFMPLREFVDTDHFLLQARSFAFLLARFRAAETALMIERHRNDSGTLPEDLTQLVPTYGERLPQDPFTNDPLIYVRDRSGYAVYSVGPNRIDDAGQLDPPPISQAPPPVRSYDAPDWGIRVRR